MSTDRIEKKILLHAPIARVWRALSDASEFGAWFGITVDGSFAPGAVMRGTITGTKVDPEVAKMQQAHAGKTFEIVIDRMETERLFSFRWHPHAIDNQKDYSGEPMTLVSFTLEQTPEGVLLTVTESGFDQIPLERRAVAFSSNEQGWGLVIHLVEKYLANEDSVTQTP